MSILNGLLTGLRVGVMVVSAIAGMIIGVLAICAVVSVVCWFIGLLTGESQNNDAEDSDDGE